MYWMAMICDFVVAVIETYVAVLMFNSQKWFLGSINLGLAIMLYAIAFKFLCRIMKGE